MTLYAKAFKNPFFHFTATIHSISEIKKVILESLSLPLLMQHPILFIDEIHRLNKAKQDLFLPFVEKGEITLIGATTENPSFTINNALLSRLSTFSLKPLNPKALSQITHRYIDKENPFKLTQEAQNGLIAMSHGDGRFLLNLLENLKASGKKEINFETLCSIAQKKPSLYDRNQDFHYHLISALHKSVRGSDPDAALYWLCRMLEGGEDPHFLVRRLVRIAIEDIGLADPYALDVTLNAWQAYERLGSPEGELALAQATLYLALAPKSAATYQAFSKAKHFVQRKHLNAPHLSTSSMLQLNL